MKSFLLLYLEGFAIIMVMMTTLWIFSVILKDAGIVDIFWGLGFVLVSGYFLLYGGELTLRRLLVFLLVAAWGIRLSLHIGWRNAGRGEDFRYAGFREKYGRQRYWWVSFFQVFLLQGVLLWLVSSTLLGALSPGGKASPDWTDYAGMAVWLTGFIFETVGDAQLSSFRANPANRGRLLTTGLWKFSRHPNYFGDATVWWGFAILSVSAGCWPLAAGAVLMTFLIIRISGVAMLEKSLLEKKPDYREYARKTSPFFPWFPKQK